MLSIEEWIATLPDFQKADIIKIKRGDLSALQSYSSKLSVDMTEILENDMTQNIVAQVSNKAKADYVRTNISPVVSITHDLTSGLSYDSMTSVLKDRGLLFLPSRSTDITDRLKDIIAGGLNWIIDKEDYNAGFNVYRSGFQQIVESGVRTTIENTSLKVKQRTGSSLKGRRVVRNRANSCEYCIEKSSSTFELGINRNHAKFHDYCRCSLEIV